MGDFCPPDTLGYTPEINKSSRCHWLEDLVAATSAVYTVSLCTVDRLINRHS